MPGNVIAAVLLLAALTPGFAFHQAFRRFSPKDARSSTTEVVELFSVGALTTVAGLVLTAALGELIPALVTLDTVVTTPEDFRDRPWSWVASAALSMTLSLVLSTLAGSLAGKRSSQRQGAGMREGTVAVRALTDRSPQGRKPFLAIELTDGRLVEGRLRYVSTDRDPARRDIVLQHPLAWTGPGDSPRTASEAKLILIPGSLVSVVHVSYPS
ncbi:DUF6338 family protein [Micromonospora cremea]|uniref:Uncharacterized protein n=1 Tax=Micromonospora cremea TaxID=709881 RepID=A0A1N5VDR4_9ACTN|nr:DUF6338 family protein [Micromonospora cremea]SIM71254.1 hypothetical protein SAMN04489832_1570 [Micromonospora cremea]